MYQSRLASCFVATTAFLLAFGLTAVRAETEQVKVAIPDFAYTDTSGEPSDQTAAHRKRLQAFMGALRADFESDHVFRLLPSSCPPLCADDVQRPAALLQAAAKTDAKVVVTGGIQKLSTLIQWAKVTAFDVETNRVVFDRLFTFRGDSDEAWQRAEVFVSRDVRAALGNDRPAHGEPNQAGDRHD